MLNIPEQIPLLREVTIQGYPGIERHNCKIATWNMNSLRKYEKLENIKLELNRLAIDIVARLGRPIMGIIETASTKVCVHEI